MAVEIRDMVSDRLSFNRNSKIYIEKIELSGIDSSDIIAIPDEKILGGSIQIIGDGTVYVTNASNTDIENETADIWEMWDGLGEINWDGITAIKALTTEEGDSGVITIMIKTQLT